MDFNDLDGSWESITDQVTTTAAAGQLAAAGLANRYTNSLSREYGERVVRNEIDPYAFVGVDGSGRDLDSLLNGALTTTKQAVRAGLGPRALEAGAAFLAAMVSTAIEDLSRQADQTAGIAKGYVICVRVVEPGACSRCVILAGSTQFGPFQRHPECRCTVMSIPGDDRDNPKYTSRWNGPQGVFDDMSREEQDRVFGRANAEAIRGGADPISVVSARRGARTTMRSATGQIRQTPRLRETVIGQRPDGSLIRGYTTVEGNTVRGIYGRRAIDYGSDSIRLQGARYRSTKRVRLMPETILQLTDDPAERRVLLADSAYIQIRGNTGAEIVAATRSTREQADAIYARLGVQIR